MLTREESLNSLRTAFQNEVHPGDYLSRVVITAILIGAGMCAMYCMKNGALHPEFILPLQGWYPRDPSGTLYMENWATIAVNSLMIGFAIWGAWLLILGVAKIPLTRRFVPTCFSMGAIFLTIAYYLPQATQVICTMLIQYFPALSN